MGRLKINEKDAGVGPFKNKTYSSNFNEWQVDSLTWRGIFFNLTILLYFNTPNTTKRKSQSILQYQAKGKKSLLFICTSNSRIKSQRTERFRENCVFVPRVKARQSYLSTLDIQYIDMGSHTVYQTGQWLWLSLPSGRLWYQRSAVRIQSSANFIMKTFTVNCWREEK